MSRQSGCVGLILLGLAVGIGGGAVLTAIMKGRANQDRAYCANNLRQLGLFAAAIPPASDAPLDPRIAARNAVPPGTVLNPALAPDRRLSWVPEALPFLDRAQPNAQTILAPIDRSLPWDAEKHLAASRTRLGALTCPGNPPTSPPDAPALTQYVGSAGVGAGAAGWAPQPEVPPTAGCFRYDGPTAYAFITDGLSATILFAETDHDLGPWLQGGPSTVRGLLEGAPTPVGVDGQFGGNHAGGGNFGFADGSVRFLSERIDPAVFRGLVTIAGNDAAGEL